MISFIRLEGELFLGGETVFFKFVDFICEDHIGFVSGVDTVGLKGNQEFSSVFQIHMAIFRDDTGLIGLGNIGKDQVDHADQESVVSGLSSVVNDGDHVSSLFSHIDQITSDSVGEFNGVNNSFWADDVRDMRDSSARSSSQIQNLGSRNNPCFRDTSDN